MSASFHDRAGGLRPKPIYVVLTILALIPCACSMPQADAKSANRCKALRWPQLSAFTDRGFGDNSNDELYSADDYNDLRQAAKCYPYLRASIVKAAADGKVSPSENSAV